MEVNPQKLYITENDFIAYQKHEGKENNVGVVFLCGFMSDMEGIKAIALENFCKERGHSFIRFDYFGHGKSSRKFTDCTIGIWKQNVLDVLDRLTCGKQILIGSSMGGWLMMLSALARPERIGALIGVACAPDFTEDLIWGKMSDVAKKELLQKGIYMLKSEFSDHPYPVTKRLIEEGREHLLLQNIEKNTASSRFNGIENKQLTTTPCTLANILCPVNLIHGLKDTDVPSSISVHMAQLLTNTNAQVNLVEHGDHRMSTPENIRLLLDTLEETINYYVANRF